MVRILIAVLVAFTLAGVTLLSYANAAVPGDALYGLDLQLEAMRLSLTNDPISRGKLLVASAQERLEEIRLLAQEGDADNFSYALSVLGQNLLMAGASLDATDESQMAQFDTVIAQALSATVLPVTEAQDPDPTDEPEPETEDEEPRPGLYCDGSSEAQHPVGLKLAEQFGSDYATIMGWFCQGYGFGEIALAYQISQVAGVSVEEVFEKRASGMGWGQIMQEYGLIGKDKPKPEKGQGKPEKTPKPKPVNPGKGKGAP